MADPPSNVQTSGDDGHGAARVLVLCTGNAARSVMAGFMLENRLGAAGKAVVVKTGGTHAVDGQPISMRTRAALGSIPELADAPVSLHRSHQVTPVDLHQADLVLVMEADHIRYLRRQHPDTSRKAAMIRPLCQLLPAGPSSLAARVASLELERLEPSPADDVMDPAGHEEEVYVDCARMLWDLCGRLAERL